MRADAHKCSVRGVARCSRWEKCGWTLCRLLTRQRDPARLGMSAGTEISDPINHIPLAASIYPLRFPSFHFPSPFAILSSLTASFCFVFILVCFFFSSFSLLILSRTREREVRTCSRLVASNAYICWYDVEIAMETSWQLLRIFRVG